MTRILDAFEELLQTRSYAQLKINDIAREANTGAGSIYARFRDKRSILLAVQHRLRERARSYFDELYNPQCWADTCLENALERVVRGNMTILQQNRNLIKSSLLLDDRDILESISNAVSPTNVRFASLLQHHLPKLTKLSATNAAAKTLRVMTAVFHQMAIFGDIAATGYDLSDDELVRALVLSALAQLPEPRPAGRKRVAAVTDS